MTPSSQRNSSVLVVLAFLMGIGITTFALQNPFIDAPTPKITKPSATFLPTPITNSPATTNTPTATPSASASETATPQPVKLKDLAVTWFKDTKLLKPSDIGLTQDKLPKDSYFTTLDEAFTIYHVGTVTTAPFANKKFLLIYRKCEGPCGSFEYRVIDDRGAKGLVLLANLSDDAGDTDKDLFIFTREYDVPALHLPPRISITYQGKSISLASEDFSPATTTKDFLAFIPQKRKVGLDPVRKATIQLTHPQYGTFSEVTGEGYFAVNRPDSSIKLYHLDSPFTPKVKTDEFLPQSYRLTLNLKDQTSFTGDYTDKTPEICPPHGYTVFDDSIRARLEEKGTVGNSGIKFYELKSATDPMYSKLLEQMVYGETTVTNDKLIKSHGLIFIQDALGRWVGLKNMQFVSGPEAECGYFNSVL